MHVLRPEIHRGVANALIRRGLVRPTTRILTKAGLEVHNHLVMDWDYGDATCL
jgi:hypothetical protein